MVTDDYRLNGRKSARRLTTYLARLRGIFGSDRAIDITADRLTADTSSRVQDGAAPATAANELAALKRGFSPAVRTGRLARRPAFPVIRLDNARTGFFEDPEFRALRRSSPPIVGAS